MLTIYCIYKNAIINITHEAVTAQIENRYTLLDKVIENLPTEERSKNI